MRKLATAYLSFAILSSVLVTTPAFAAAPVPRKAAEFTATDPTGKPISLASLKGKVVVMTFMYTTCPHCQHEAQMVTKLQHDYAAKGFQAMGAAFNFEDKDPAPMRAATVAKFISEFGVGYPVGYSSPLAVQTFLGLSVMDRYVVPQVAVIDRKGMVVAQSDPTMGSEELQTEASLRALVEKLLKGGVATSSATVPPVKTAKAN
jgi:peroxiredoxin